MSASARSGPNVRIGASEERYVASCSDPSLDARAEAIRSWTADGRDVTVTFDNDRAGNAPRDARRLLERLG